MKSFIIGTLALLVLAGCSIPKEPRMAFGKKCSETNNGQIAYSYVWLYSKSDGLKADADTCRQLEQHKNAEELKQEK